MKETTNKKITTDFKTAMFYALTLMVVGGQALILAIFAWPKIIEFSNAFAKLNAAREELSAVSSATKFLSETNSETTENWLSKSISALPDEKKVSGVVSGITKLASSSGVVVLGLSFSPGIVFATESATNQINTGGEFIIDNENNVLALPVSLSVRSSITALIDFVKKLSVVNQLVGVTGVSYSGNDTDGSISLDLLVYYQPRDISKFDWKKIKPLTSEEVKKAETMAGQDVFILEP